METGRKKKKDEELPEQTSLIIDYENEVMIEQVLKERKSRFCIYNNKTKKIKYKDSVEYQGKTYIPIYGEEIEKRVILLPEEPEQYNSDEELDIQISEFINKWLDVPKEFLQFAIWNIKRSWVFERFHTINYLRALGDTGQGKSRFLDALGYLHYKPMATSGATTSAPIFRFIDKWRGTIIMDEADFSKSDESQDIIKIINMGYEKGKFIMRCDQNDAKKINFFDPFCPKVIATRKTFTDKAVESRCITQVMVGTKRKDIPYNINNNFWIDVKDITNKLLMWRFNHFFNINPELNIELDIPGLEPRVKQIVSSLINLFGKNEKELERFKNFIINYQEDLIEERKNSFDGQIVGIIQNYMENGEMNISCQEITEKMSFNVSPRTISSHLKSLGFDRLESRKVNGYTKRCIPLDVVGHLKYLFERYGYGVTIVTQYTETPQYTNFEKKMKMEKFTSHHMHRNYRNSVTEKVVSEKGILPLHLVVEKDEKPLDILDIIRKIIKKEPKDNLLDILKYVSEEDIMVLKKKGDIYEPKKGQIALI